MLTLFKNSRDRHPPRNPPNLNNVKRTVFENYERITKYWRNMNWGVPSQHILVEILNYINVIGKEPLSIYNGSYDQVTQITMAKQFVSAVQYGRVQEGCHFFGKGCTEIYMQQQFDDAVDQILTKHYTEWEAVRVVYHPFSSIDYQLANGKPRKSGERGRCIIKMDCQLLYTQYKMWRADIARSEYSDGTPKSVMNFIHSYPVVNMMKSQIEASWYNRFLNTAFDIPNNNEPSDKRLALVNSYYYMEEIDMKLWDDIKRARGNFNEWLCWIPGLFTKNYKEFLKQDDVLIVQQNELTITLGLLRALSFVFYTAVVSDNKVNGREVNEYFRQYRYYKSARIFGTIRGIKAKSLINEFTNKINKYAKQL